MRIVKNRKNAITYPKGFRAAGLHCGIKAKEKDLALIYSDRPACGAAVFTTNRVTAWPVQHSVKVTGNSRHRAIVVNSGNANCFNGHQGKIAVADTVAFLAHELGIARREVFVASTGVIGRPLKIDAIVSSIPELCFSLSREGGHNAAKAIMTTDTVPKEVAATCTIKGVPVRIGGMAKGVGMLKPNMATMLAFVTTDALIRKPLLQSMVRDIVSETFNCISVDNDTSTNDSVFVLANGSAGNAPVTGKKTREYAVVKEALTGVCWELARLLVKDGEGASRVCEIGITGARTAGEAYRAAERIANSMLFKTALAGGDPNWGRIIAALGADTGIHCAFDRIDLFFGTLPIMKNGVPKFDDKKARKEFSKKEVVIRIDLKSGKHEARFLTTDLTKEYVRINAEYTT